MIQKSRFTNLKKIIKNKGEDFIQTQSAFVAIVGKPNVGKSTLINALTGQKIAIVTNKPQTTRTKIMGILTDQETQLVFIDTPGLHKAKTKLGTHMVKAVRDSVADIDVALLVVEPTGVINAAEKDLIERFKVQKIPAILVINKIDALKNKALLMERISKFMEEYDFSSVVPVSALTRNGLNSLLQEIKKFSVEGVHYFPDDTLTDQPERVLLAEMIREQILLHLREEIPHGIAVEIEKMKLRKSKGLYDIEATIYCERDNHKGMLIGKNGEMLKRIASNARTEMEQLLDSKINLQCWVKTKEDWRNKEGFIQSLGLS